MKVFRLLFLSAAVAAAMLSCASAPPKAEPGQAEAAVEPIPAEAVSAEAVSPEAISADAAPVPSAAPVLVDLALFDSAPEACRAVLKKSVALASEGKWKSAVASLDEFDAAAADPYVLAVKTKLLMAGAVQTDALRSFALVDLEPGQDIEELRASGDEYELFQFNPPELAETQAMNGVPIPPVLSAVLGDYYYEVLLGYQDLWASSPYEIAQMSAMRYQAAFDGGFFVPESLRKLAELYSGLEMYAEIDPVYRKMIEADPDDPQIHYGLAISLQKREMIPQMLDELDRSIEAYGDSADKAGIVALAAITAHDLGDEARSQAYLAASDASFAGTSMAGLLRHYVAANVGDMAATEAAAGKLLDEYGTDFNVARDVVVIWFQAGELADVRSFVEKRVAAGGESLAVGNLELLLSMLILQGEMGDQDRVAATAALDDAEKRMKESLPEDDPVFATVADVRAALVPLPEEEPFGAEPAEEAESASE